MKNRIQILYFLLCLIATNLLGSIGCTTTQNSAFHYTEPPYIEVQQLECVDSIENVSAVSGEFATVYIKVNGPYPDLPVGIHRLFIENKGEMIDSVETDIHGRSRIYLSHGYYKIYRQESQRRIDSTFAFELGPRDIGRCTLLTIFFGSKYIP